VKRYFFILGILVLLFALLVSWQVLVKREPPSRGHKEAVWQSPVSPLPFKKPVPQVRLETKDYTSQELKKFTRIPISLKFGQTYTIGDSKKFIGEIIASMLNQAEGMGLSSQELKSSLEAVVSKTIYPSLPSYAEKAKFGGEDAWIIVVNWGKGKEDVKLSRVRIYALSPKDQKILSSFSK